MVKYTKYNQTNPAASSRSDAAKKAKQITKQLACYAQSNGHFEITMNLPRTDLFTSQTSEKQRECYAFLFEAMRNVAGFDAVQQINFEFCKTGHIHAHCLILPAHGYSYISCGCIADMVKRFCIAYTKYHVEHKIKRPTAIRYNEKFMHFDYDSYSSPAITINHISAKRSEATSRFNYWVSYMRKDINEHNHNVYLQAKAEYESLAPSENAPREVF